MYGRTHTFGRFPPLSSPKDDDTPKSSNLFVLGQKSSGHSTMAARILENFVGSTSDLSKKGETFDFRVSRTVRFVSVDISIDGYEMSRMCRIESCLSCKKTQRPKKEMQSKQENSSQNKKQQPKRDRKEKKKKHSVFFLSTRLSSTRPLPTQSSSPSIRQKQIAYKIHPKICFRF